MNREKRIIGIIVIVLIVILIALSFNNPTSGLQESSLSLWELDEYKKIQLEDIQFILIEKYRESGVHTDYKNTPAEIEKTYQYLSGIKIGKEISFSCDDNTTIYYLSLKNGEEVSIEIECGWLVLNNKRYDIIQ